MVERDFVIVCFENSVLCTGSQKETLALSCFTSCFKTSLLRTGKQKWPIVTFVSSFRVVVCLTIKSILTIIGKLGYP